MVPFCNCIWIGKWDSLLLSAFRCTICERGSLIFVDIVFETDIGACAYQFFLLQTYNMDHLVIPTRDYLFAPSYGDICQAVNFIHGNTLLKFLPFGTCFFYEAYSHNLVLVLLTQFKPKKFYSTVTANHFWSQIFAGEFFDQGDREDKCSNYG